MTRTSGITLAAVLLVLLAAAVFVLPSFRDPRFEVVNESGGAVTAVARWAGRERLIGELRSSSSRRFSVDGEAGMQFRVRYAGGREVTSDEVYFTPGVTVVAVIREDGVEVGYDFHP